MWGRGAAVAGEAGDQTYAADADWVGVAHGDHVADRLGAAVAFALGLFFRLAAHELLRDAAEEREQAEAHSANGRWPRPNRQAAQGIATDHDSTPPTATAAQGRSPCPRAV